MSDEDDGRTRRIARGRLIVALAELTNDELLVVLGAWCIPNVAKARVMESARAFGLSIDHKNTGLLRLARTVGELRDCYPAGP